MALDPAFALAHAGYADAQLMTAFHGLHPPMPALEQARISAEEALSLDASFYRSFC